MIGKPRDQDLFRPRPPGGSRRGTAAAVLVHLLLVGAIALGVNWRSSEPDGVSAELWSAVPQAAAPRATTTEAEPPAPPKPQPEPAPAPAPAPPPPPPPRPEPAAREEPDAQIAVEARRKEEARKKAELEERREQERKKQREEDQKEEQRQAKDRERQKTLKEQKEREEKEKERQEERDKARAQAQADKKRDEQETLKKKQAADAAAAENARIAAQRNQALERIKGMAGASGGPTDTGNAAQSSGPSSSYGGRIRARVKPNIVFNEQVDGNPVAEVEVRLAPDGRILSQRLVRSSGVRAWDDAVQRAVERTEVFPRDVDGRVPSVPILLTFRPRD